ncbi:MAG: lysylphosphatidylglycerol synthase transmembrane domain-containing protein [Actinomycetota bacterium]
MTEADESRIAEPVVVDADVELATEVVARPVRRPVVGRVVARVAGLAITAIGLYVIWPALVQTFSQLPRLQTINPAWFVAMVAVETASFASFWVLLGLCVHSRDRFVIATSQLASNMIGRIVPGGAATGGAMQLRMLIVGGVDAARATTGVATATLLTTAVLFGMPVLSVPAILGGATISDGLAGAVFLGLLLFAIMIAVGVLALRSDRPVLVIGRTFAAAVSLVTRGDRDADLPARLLRERDLVRRTLDRHRWTALGSAVAKSILEYLALLAALTAVGASPRPGLVVLAYTASAILAMVPITPGGLGFVEAGLSATLTLAGVTVADAVLATLAFRLVSYWLPLPIGALALALFRRRFGRI